MIGGKMIGHRPISTSQHHPGAQRRQLRTGAIEAEQGQRGHGGRKPGKGMNLATSPQNECENRRRRPSRGLAHTPGTPIFALFRWTSERAASIRCPDGGSGQGSFASFLKGPLPPSGHRIERGTIDLQSDINCLPERSLLGAFGKQHDDYDHDVFNSAGSTLATPHFGPENGVHLTSTPRVGPFPAHSSFSWIVVSGSCHGILTQIRVVKKTHRHPGSNISAACRAGPHDVSLSSLSFSGTSMDSSPKTDRPQATSDRVAVGFPELSWPPRG